MPPKNSGGSTKFLGGHKVIHRTAQTVFVRVVTPRDYYKVRQYRWPMSRIITDRFIFTHILGQFFSRKWNIHHAMNAFEV